MTNIFKGFSNVGGVYNLKHTLSYCNLQISRYYFPFFTIFSPLKYQNIEIWKLLKCPYYRGRLFYGKLSESKQKGCNGICTNLMKRNKYMFWLCYEKNRDSLYGFGKFASWHYGKILRTNRARWIKLTRECMILILHSN